MSKLKTAEAPAQKRSRISQSDIPAHTIDEAIRVVKALQDHGFDAVRPIDVAAAMGLSPTSSSFRMITGAAVAYGLTSGGYGTEAISATKLGQTTVEPQEEGGVDIEAKRQAVLKPRLIAEFLKKYDGRKLPSDIKITHAVLANLGVPRDAVDRAYKVIMDNAKAVGFLQDIKGSSYVNLQGAKTSTTSSNVQADMDGEAEPFTPQSPPEQLASPSAAPPKTVTTQRAENRRVFITHGKNRAIIDPLKDMIAYGEMEPIVAMERESVSQPVPDKVMSDMRSCSAAVIHVEGERELIDKDGARVVVLNPNVLIEIGAAMALFGRRFILLVREGVSLPSNLQGLYEVRYQGDKLDSEATMKLLKAMKDIKNYQLPADTAPVAKIGA